MSAHDGSKYQEQIEAEKCRRADQSIAADPKPSTLGEVWVGNTGPSPTRDAPAYPYPAIGVDHCPLDSQSTGDITEVLGEVMTALRRLPPYTRERVLAAATALLKPDPPEY